MDIENIWPNNVYLSVDLDQSYVLVLFWSRQGNIWIHQFSPDLNECIAQQITILFPFLCVQYFLVFKGHTNSPDGVFGGFA